MLKREQRSHWGVYGVSRATTRDLQSADADVDARAPGVEAVARSYLSRRGPAASATTST